MPGKRKRKRNNQIFSCPYCQTKLWRLGSPKHYIYYQEISELQANLNLSRKKASLLMAQNSTYLNQNSWIEDFCCQQHGSMWLKIERKDNLKLDVSLATEKDWQNSTGTINPNFPNPSVSEFSYAMSRKPRLKSGAC